MKKVIALLILCSFGFLVFAQQEVDKTEKVKKTANLGEKVHNVFSKNKHYDGYKVKKIKEVNGHEVKSKTKVTYAK
ncbi:MAG TPA: hypothetical protein VFE53_24795 [Mucilaginibacter sp.]|jgi:hypothetical protein|nr:hypothetical protein [Mucilaginibacter sp.]